MGWKKCATLIAREEEMWPKWLPPLMRPEPVGGFAANLLFEQAIDFSGQFGVKSSGKPDLKWSISIGRDRRLIASGTTGNPDRIEKVAATSMKKSAAGKAGSMIGTTGALINQHANDSPSRKSGRNSTIPFADRKSIPIAGFKCRLIDTGC
jgi:hypothetical protein